MKIAGPKSMRDFYPEDMARREWIESAWDAASRRAGFLSWDGPILETLELYERKSGPEIVEQLYRVTTKGGAELGVRPEMTPTLARMIAVRQSALPRPVKWYTIGRMCRYERGQRGRLREFWQWNVDVLGLEDIVADAEVISVALDGLIELGLSADDVVARINSRSMLAAMLNALSVPPVDHGRVYAVTDKRGKLPSSELEKLYRDIGLTPATLTGVLDLMNAATLDDVRALATRLANNDAIAEVEKLQRLFDYLDSLGKGPFCAFDIGIVRGLAYYTGPVFEIFDRKGELRAVCGGGRYDQLMQLMGGQPMPACGFGMGDVVLGELLADRGIQPPANIAIDDYVVSADERSLAAMLAVVNQLRRQGHRVDYAARPGNANKIIKRAMELGARRLLTVDVENVTVRDLVTREEKTLSQNDFLE